MPRVYERRFDYEEARLRRANGELVSALAAEYGVTAAAIYRATTPGLPQRQVAYHREWRKTVCTVCGSPAQKAAFRGDGPRCKPCADDARATSVREGELQCVTCRQWKLDREFAFSAAARDRRRGRHQCCRACATALRREYRERKKIPCVACGKPRLPASEIGRGRDTGLCLSCYRARKVAA